MKRIFFVLLLLSISTVFRTIVYADEINETIENRIETTTIQQETETNTLYQVRFKNTITGRDKTVYVKEGERVEEYRPKLSKKYSYIGWYDQKNGKPYDFSKPVYRNFILVLACNKLDAENRYRYYINFDYNYNGISKKENYTLYTKSSLVDEPKKPYRNGFLFKGWYTKKVGGRKWDFKKDVTNGGIILYAHWKKVDYAYDEKYYKSPQTGHNARVTIESLLSLIFALSAAFVSYSQIKKEQ